MGANAGFAADRDHLAAALKKTASECLGDEGSKRAAGAIDRDLRRRRDTANARDRAAWAAIEDRETWESYRDERLRRLRRSLGDWPEAPAELRVETTGRIEAEGFVIENIVFEARPDQWVPGNLYLPKPPHESMPGITITHAHHQGKEQGELQDMGMTWARAGCAVLVIDQVGYGERGAHPFEGEDDYAGDDKYWRQDYYYRYDSGIQLGLVGESLMGWMVWDQMRAIDVLLAHAGADPNRIIMLGAVAGGGDPCGITAALDERVAAAVPFNFGGPQPETVFPLPDDAETSFNYLMGSYWDSTRGLYGTAAEGYFHWLITASIAPRRVIHAHEFAWDGERDPVWRRYQKIYGQFYGKPDNLTVTHGRGLLRQKAPAASHCGQIGRYHRRMIHPVFKRWFGIEAEEYSARLDKARLRCLTPEARRKLDPLHFNELNFAQAEERVANARKGLEGVPAGQRKQLMRRRWIDLLGDIGPSASPKLLSAKTGSELADDGISIRRLVLEVEPDVVVPVILLSPEPAGRRLPVVVALAHSGKAAFLKKRSHMIADLLCGGMAVCLTDLRGCGETGEGSARGRTSGDTHRSVNMQLHDQTLLGQRLRDLRSVIAWLREEKAIDPKRISLWGENLVPANPRDTDFQIPHDVGGRPPGPEPLGGLLAMLGALFDPHIERIYIRGGLLSFRSVLEIPHVYIPHDVAVKGALTAGDLSELAATLAPRPLRCDSLVDGLGRHVSNAVARTEYRPAMGSYQEVEGRFVLDGETSPADWLLTDGVSSRLFEGNRHHD